MRPAPTHLAAGLGLALGLACSVYTPTFRDCALRCGENDACPAGTTCNQGFCRPNGFSGACDCTPGDSQTCGGGRGECRAGLRTCLDTRIWGPCIGEVRPSTEICDGKDNDCDGFIDEDPSDAPACPLTQGVCANSTQRCVDGGYVDECGPTLYGPQYEPIEQTCDGLDNDCDGVVDSRAPTTVASNVNVWAARATQSGFTLFAAPESATVLTVHFLTPQLQPRGAPVTIDLGVPITAFHNAAGGPDMAAVGLRRADGVGIVVRASDDGGVQRLGFAEGFVTSSSGLAVHPETGVLAAYEVDGGIRLHRWPGDATTSIVTPYTTRFPVDAVTRLSLSEDGTVLAWDGDYTPPDGGSSESAGGVESLDGGRAVAFTGISRTPPVFATSRLQSFYSFSNYVPLFPFNINESGVTLCYDIWQGSTCSSVARIQDHTLIRGANSTRMFDVMVVSWIDSGQLKVGVSAPQVQQVRTRVIQQAGAVVAEGSVAWVPGSDFLAVFYRTQEEPTKVQALLMCSP